MASPQAFILQDSTRALVLSATLYNGGSPVPNGTLTFTSINDGSTLGTVNVVNHGSETKIRVAAHVNQNTHDSASDSTWYFDLSANAHYSVGGVTVSFTNVNSMMDNYSGIAPTWSIMLDPDGHSVWTMAWVYDDQGIQKYDTVTKSLTDTYYWPFNPIGFGSDIGGMEDGSTIWWQDSQGHLYGFSGVHSGSPVGLNNPQDLARIHKMDMNTKLEVAALGYDDLHTPPSANPVNSVYRGLDWDWAVYSATATSGSFTSGHDYLVYRSRTNFSSSIMSVIDLTTMTIVGTFNPGTIVPPATFGLIVYSVFFDKNGVVWGVCTDGGDTSQLYLISWNPADGTTTSPGTPEPPDPWLNNVTLRHTIAGSQWQSGSPNSNFPFAAYVSAADAVMVGDVAPAGPTGNESDLALFALNDGHQIAFQSGAADPAPFYSGTFDIAYSCMRQLKAQPWLPNTSFAMEVATSPSLSPLQDGGVMNVIDPTTLAIQNTYNLTTITTSTVAGGNGYTDQGVWSSSTHYHVADMVTGSDGFRYVAKAPSGPGSSFNAPSDPAFRDSAGNPTYRGTPFNASIWSGIPTFTEHIRGFGGTGSSAFTPHANMVYIQSAGNFVFTHEFVGGLLMMVTIPGNGPFLSDLVSDVCKRSGLDVSSQIDVSQISNIPIRGYLITNKTDAKSALQAPLAAYFVDGVESDFLLKFIPRGANPSVLQIPESDLGLEADKAKLTETIGQQQELAREVEVLFVDPNINWQQNKQQKKRSSRAVKTKQAITIQLPLVLTTDEARAIAEKALYLAYLEARPFDFNLFKMAYSVLDPTDVAQFVYEGHVFQIRLLTTSLGVGYSIAVSGVSHETATYNSVVQGGDAGGVPPNPVKPSVNTVLFLLDVPYLEDTDAVADRSHTGYYMGMTAATSDWPGGVEFKSDDNTTFDSVDSSADRMVYGTCTNTLGNPPSLWTWDTVNTLTIMLADPTWSLSGTTDIAVLNGANILIVNGEVIQYVNAHQNMDGSFTVSRLLRGRRNTEYAATGHGPGEKAFDPTTGLKHEDAQMALIGILRYYRGVTVGQDITLVPSQTFTINANDLKPASVVHVNGSRDMSGNLTIGWTRRTRYNGDWLNNTGNVPLNEDSEQYDIDIYNGLFVVRTIHWIPGTYDANGNPDAVYTAAQQTTDFGSAQSSVTMNIFQISAQVGRGFQTTATV